MLTVGFSVGPMKTLCEIQSLGRNQAVLAN
jgi:hypothetical protein